MNETRYYYSLSAARNRSNEKIEVQAAGKKNYTEKANKKFDPFSVRNPIAASMTSLFPYRSICMPYKPGINMHASGRHLARVSLSPYGPPYS